MGTLSQGVRSRPQPPTTFGVAPCRDPSADQPGTRVMRSPQVGELIDKLRAVFVETLDELSWMDESSKKKAQEKVGRRLGEGGPSARGTG